MKEVKPDSNRFLCIICKEDKNIEENTIEHVFPEAIGGALTISNVCRTCNSWLGSDVDSYLTNNFLFQAECQDLKLALKNGKIPNILKKGSLETDQDRTVYYTMDEEGNPKDLYVTPKITKEYTKNGDLRISASVDFKDKEKLAEMINKTFEREGFSKIDPDTILQNMTIIKEKPIMKIHPSRIKVPKNISYSKEEIIIDTLRYKLSIAKIAYELSYYWLGSKFLDDETGNQIRLSLLEKNISVNTLKQFQTSGIIEYIGESPSIDIWKHLDDAYIGVMVRLSGFIFIYIKLLNVIEGLILVSKQSFNYKNYEDKIVIIDPRNRTHQENILRAELEVLGNREEIFQQLILNIGNLIKKTSSER